MRWVLSKGQAGTAPTPLRRKHSQPNAHAAVISTQWIGNTLNTTPTLHGMRTEADNRKATPRHVAWDASVQGASGAFLSTHFWTNYIDRVSPCTHDSRIGQTRALATCVMADQNGRCCAERALKGRPVRRSRHCYRTEPGTNGHILLSVHGFTITSYLLASTASEAAIGREHVVQLGPR